MSDEERAKRCATGVNVYWAALGYHAGAKAEERSDRSVRACEVGAAIDQATRHWVVTSKLANGMPPGCDSRRVPLYGAKKRAEG